MKRFKRLLLNMMLMSIGMGLSVEGEAPPGFDPAAGGSDPAGGDTGGVDTAAAEAAAAAQAEADRVAALSPEEKAAESAAAAAVEAQKLEAAKLVGAPVEYSAFTMPEGTTVEGIDAVLGSISKKFNLSQEGGQELLNAFAKDVQPLLQADRQKQWLAVQEGWKAEAAADPEIGGAKYAENVEIAKRAIGTFMTPDIKQVLEEYGIGNHPGMVRLMVKIGKAIREDTFVTPAEGSTPESKLAGLYPTMTK